MRQHFRKLLALILFALALNAATFAQDFEQKVRASIPFGFYAGSKVMPAGIYTFAINRQSHNILIYETDKGMGAFLLGSPHDGSKDDRTLLTFRANAENVYVLQKLEGPDFGVSFSGRKSLSRLAEERQANDTQTVVAELVR